VRRVFNDVAAPGHNLAAGAGSVQGVGVR
jgi:hypothetical protein